MLQRLIAARVISSPAIWGKLPGHADFVRSGVRHGESDAWRPWLAEHCETATTDVDPLVVPPASFVLPPATLACSPRHFVVGVIAPSVDRVGRRHPLLVYQMARPRWVERHFRSNAGQPLDWFFWLARVVGHHLRKGSDVMKLERAVRAQWELHAPQWSDIAGRHPGPDHAAARARAQLAFDEWADPVDSSDPAHRLVGVRHLPWADWPQRLQGRHGASAFWQQDTAGGYVNAVVRLKDLWRNSH
jgi:type VI secretion system protein ImpM